MNEPMSLLSKADQEQITACIKEAEKRTTGEIRVYVEDHCPQEDPLKRCEEVFQSLNMHLTAARNGVLIYLATKDKKFAIGGDEGIHQKAGGNAYWHTAAEMLKKYLKEGKVAEGLCRCITEIGGLLATHFPPDGSESNNQLPDEIAFG